MSTLGRWGELPREGCERKSGVSGTSGGSGGSGSGNHARSRACAGFGRRVAGRARAARMLPSSDGSSIEARAEDPDREGIRSPTSRRRAEGTSRRKRRVRVVAERDLRSALTTAARALPPTRAARREHAHRRRALRRVTRTGSRRKRRSTSSSSRRRAREAHRSPARRRRSSVRTGSRFTRIRSPTSTARS